jgi:hypothetical protein
MLPLKPAALSLTGANLPRRDKLCLEKSQISAFLRCNFAHSAETFIIIAAALDKRLDDGAETPLLQGNHERP